MLNKEECEKVLETLNYLGDFKDGTPALLENEEPKAYGVIKQLIKDHFESKENTLEFKNFKLHANSTLKNMPKDELISYIHMLHHNWDVSDKQLFNVIEKIKTLQDGLDAIKNPQPYKFEDLKELIGKPIFDYKYKEFYILAEVKEEELYKDEGLEKFMICSDKKGLMRVFFEEGRFFPVTKALEYQK